MTVFFIGIKMSQTQHRHEKLYCNLMW